jgi:hypothetical protein
VTLPAEVTLVSVSASNAICSGSRVVTCDFAELDPLATATVALNVRARRRATSELAQAHRQQRQQRRERHLAMSASKSRAVIPRPPVAAASPEEAAAWSGSP